MSIDPGSKVFIINRMPRPKKKPGTVMDRDIRIPVTAEQKDRLKKAAELNGTDLTAWARPILLRAADRVLANKGREV